MANTRQPDGDVFLRKPHKLGYILTAVIKPIAPHKYNTVFGIKLIYESLNNTGLFAGVYLGVHRAAVGYTAFYFPQSKSTTAVAFCRLFSVITLQ